MTHRPSGGDFQESADGGLRGWQHAVDLGALGEAAAARRVLAGLDADPATSTAMRSLAASTAGSLIRQAGGHRRARTDDGRAAALLTGVRRSGELADRAAGSPPWLAAAWADALIGLAADALGIADFTGAAALLGRVDAFLGDAPGEPHPDTDWRTLPRVALRASWVRIEWGLYSGDHAAAFAELDRLHRRSAVVPSARHRVKTTLIAAAAAAAAGELDHARAGAADGHRQAVELGLLPLRWAAASMLAGLGPDRERYAAEVQEVQAVLARRGMRITPLDHDGGQDR